MRADARSAAVALALVAACRGAPDDSAARNAVRAATARYVAASVAGDAHALAELYAEGAVLLPPEHGAVEGRRAIEAFWQGGLEEGLEVHATRIDASGTLAWTIGRWHLPATDQDAADSGKLVLCWRREGRTWKLAADIWNSSAEPDSADDENDDERHRTNPVT